jgi:hypothetical protein
MRDAARDGIRVYVVGTCYIELPIRIGTNRAFRVAECAADVHVCGCVGCDEARIVSAPRTDNF